MSNPQENTEVQAYLKNLIFVAGELQNATTWDGIADALSWGLDDQLEGLHNIPELQEAFERSI